MSQIFITGHRNPDMDSVCAAYAYARLKSQLDSLNTYMPIRCGHLNKNTKALFERLGAASPQYWKDARPRVSSVMRTSDEISLAPDDPVGKLIALFSDSQPSVVPVVKADQLVGLLSLDDITAFFLKDNLGKRPIYHFHTSSFGKVMPGFYLQKSPIEEFDAPLMVGAMPFESFKPKIEAMTDARPILIIGNRKNHLALASTLDLPAIILTGLDEGQKPDMDLGKFKGTVYVSSLDTAETTRHLRLCQSVQSLLRRQGPAISSSDLFDDAKARLASSKLRGLAVYDDSQNWTGFVTRRCFLDKPRMKLILVDHNEPDQSIPGIEDADVIEIIDHHRLGAQKTSLPITIETKPIGSTCTLVYQLYQRHSAVLDKITATLLLSGLLSDTVLLKSPTTTFEDYTAAQDLAAIAGIEDLTAYGESLFGSGACVHDSLPRALVDGDFKTYDENGVRFGIGQCEVTTLEDVDEAKDDLLKALEQARKESHLDWTMLLITNVLTQTSVLLATDYPQRQGRISYAPDGKGKYLLPGVLSRKKQLLPEIIRVLTE